MFTAHSQIITHSGVFLQITHHVANISAVWMAVTTTFRRRRSDREETELNHPNRRHPNHPQRRQRAHAPCLVWGHVRCVYSERAVTVP